MLVFGLRLFKSQRFLVTTPKGRDLCVRVELFNIAIGDIPRLRLSAVGPAVAKSPIKDDPLNACTCIVYLDGRPT